MKIPVMQIFSKAIPEFMFRLTDVCWKSIVGVSECHMHIVSDFRKPLHKPTGGFQIADITVKTLKPHQRLESFSYS
jgi:hypothetical protein